MSSIFSDAGGYSWSRFRAPVAGQYRLRFKGYTVWVSGGGIGRWFYEGQGDEKGAACITCRSGIVRTWMKSGRAVAMNPSASMRPAPEQNRPIGAFDFNPNPVSTKSKCSSPPNEVIRTDGMRLFRTRVNGSDEQYVNPLAQPDGMPGYAIQWMEVEGPLYDASTGAGYKQLFGDLPLKRAARGRSRRGGRSRRSPTPHSRISAAGWLAADVAVAAAAARVRGGRGGGFGGRGGGGLREVKVEVVSEDPQQDAERLLKSFVQSAYRRPVRTRKCSCSWTLFKDQFGQGLGFAQFHAHRLHRRAVVAGFSFRG